MKTFTIYKSNLTLKIAGAIIEGHINANSKPTPIEEIVEAWGFSEADVIEIGNYLISQGKAFWA